MVEVDETRRDGAVIAIREIEPGDADALIRFHERLSADSIRMRYFSAHPHLSQIEAVRLTTVDHRDRQAYVAEVAGEIIGVGRYERCDAAASAAEVAFVVADEWQGHGLGPRLLARLVDHARACGFRRLTASTLAGNRPMLTVFQRSGLPIHKERDAGVVEVVMDLGTVDRSPTASGAS
jgi:RimJ/RimL family protein N-acetyltransferase